MNEGIIQIYYGEGHGKSTAAIGNAIRCASEGKSVIIIQFLKGKNENELAFLNRLEPEIKIFRFAKSDESFGKKVVTTAACDMLILDEVLGVIDEKVVAPQEMQELFENKPDDMTLICTGRVLEDSIRPYADEIYNIAPEKIRIDE